MVYLFNSVLIGVAYEGLRNGYRREFAESAQTQGLGYDEWMFVGKARHPRILK
jgi:hypothetical protein